MRKTAIKSVSIRLIAVSVTAGIQLLASTAARAAQTLYVADNFEGVVVAVDSNGNITTPSVTYNSGKVVSPAGLTFDNSGNLFVASGPTGFGGIEKLTPNGGGSFVGTLLNNSIPAFNQMAIDGSGNLYVTQASSSIYKFDPVSGAPTALNITGTSLAEPTGIVVDTSGNLYVSNFENNQIAKIAVNGTNATSTLLNLKFANGVSLSHPQGLAVDSGGNLYVANFSSNKIVKIDSNGNATNFVSTFTSGSLSNPFGLAFDTGGNLYVSNLGGDTIEKFNSNGVGTLFASGLTLEGPQQITFGYVAPTTASFPVVPEPGSLSLFGIASAGLLWRRIR